MDTDKLLKAIRILIKEELRSNLPKILKEAVRQEVKGRTKLIEKKLRKSIKKELLEQQNSQQTKTQEPTEVDPFELAQQKLDEDRQSNQQREVQSQPENKPSQEPQPQYSRNKTINEILADTAKTYNPGDLNKSNQAPKGGGVPINVQMTNNDSVQENQPITEGDPMDKHEEMLEERTMKFDSTDTHKLGMNKNGDISKSEMAAKMGYGKMSGGNKVPTETIEGKPVNQADPKTDHVKKALNRDYSELVKRFK